MAIDVAPVISALTDAGVAVAAVGGAVLLVVVSIKAFRYLGLAIDPGVSNFHWDQREGESYEEFVSRNEAQDRARGR